MRKKRFLFTKRQLHQSGRAEMKLVVVDRPLDSVAKTLRKKEFEEVDLKVHANKGISIQKV